MDTITTTRTWDAALREFERFLGLEGPERVNRLEQLRTENPALFAQVQTLLKADSQADRESFLQALALDGALTEANLPTLSTGTRIGSWLIEHRIGSGGMGEVYRAQRADGTFELTVAVKLLKRGLDTDALIARFARERRILARIDHANVAHLLDAGVAPDGRPYFVMEYVDGQPITEYARGRGLATSALLRLMITVCEAVQSAHAQRIVHRDLKPSNVLVTAHGQVKLLDFGIAKMLAEDDPESTRLSGGSTALTPSYAAPEQWLHGVATPAIDIYSLGVMLYQLLTERLPHPHDTRGRRESEEIRARETTLRPSLALRRERGRMPEARRAERQQATSGDLDLIVLKALQYEPSRRYATAQDFADDLQRLLDHRPVIARPDSLAYRGGRFLRRHWRPLTQVGLATAGVAALAIAALRLQDQREHVHRLVSLGESELRGQHFARAAAYFGAAFSQGDASVEVRFNLARAMPSVDALTDWSVGYANAHYGSFAFSPDAKTLVVADSGRGGARSFSTVWDVASRERRFTFDGTPPFGRVSISDDGRRALISGSDHPGSDVRITQVWDLANGRQLIDASGGAESRSSIPDPAFIGADAGLHRVLAVEIDLDGKARIVNVDSQQVEQTLGVPHVWIISASFDHAGNRVVTGSEKGTVIVWDASTGTVKTTIQAKPSMLTNAFFAMGDSVVVTVGDNGVVQLWNAETGEWLGSPGSAGGSPIFLGLDAASSRLTMLSAGAHEFRVLDLGLQSTLPRSREGTSEYHRDFRFQPAGDDLLATTDDGTRLWAQAGAALVASLEGGDGGSDAAAWTPDGQRILTGEDDGQLRMWDVRQLRGEPQYTLSHSGRESAQVTFGPFWVAYTPDGRHIVSAGIDAAVRVWDAATGAPNAVLTGHEDGIVHGAISPDGRLVATGSSDQTARVWELESGLPLASVKHEEPDAMVAFSPSSELVASVGVDQAAGSVRIWKARTGTMVTGLHGEGGRPVTQLMFSPDGKKLLTCHDDGARIWDVQTGARLLMLDARGGVMRSAQWSADGTRVLTAGGDRTARIWDAASARRVFDLQVPDFEPRSAIFSPDGRTVAIGGKDAARLWQPASGTVTALPPGGASTIAFSPDGTLLAGVTGDANVTVWGTASGQRLAAWSDARAGRNLSLAFSPDSQHLATAGPSSSGDAAMVWDVSLESRTPQQVADTIACKSAWRVDGEKLVPQAPHPEACPRLPTAAPSP